MQKRTLVTLIAAVRLLDAQSGLRLFVLNLRHPKAAKGQGVVEEASRVVWPVAGEDKIVFLEYPVTIDF